MSRKQKPAPATVEPTPAETFAPPPSGEPAPPTETPGRDVSDPAPEETNQDVPADAPILVESPPLADEPAAVVELPALDETPAFVAASPSLDDVCAEKADNAGKREVIQVTVSGLRRVPSRTSAYLDLLTFTIPNLSEFEIPITDSALATKLLLGANATVTVSLP